MKHLYQYFSSLVQARENCIKSNNTEWRDRHEEKIEWLAKNHMPRGSGFDAGTSFDIERSRANRLVFHTSYHHMNQDGYYVGWTEHDVIVTPDLASGFSLRITGRDRNDIKEYMYEVFDGALREESDCKAAA